MKPKKRRQRNRPKMGTAIPMGIGIGMVAVLLLACVAAELIVSGILGMGSTTVISPVIWAVASILGSLIAAKRSDGKRFLIGMACAGILLAIPAALHALIIPDAFENVISIAGSILIGGAVGALIGSKGKKRRFS